MLSAYDGSGSPGQCQTGCRRPCPVSRSATSKPCPKHPFLFRLAAVTRPCFGPIAGLTVARWTRSPDVVGAVAKRIRKTRTMVEELLNDQWIRNIQGSLSTHTLGQYVSLWNRMQGVRLRHDVADKFLWKWSPDRQYSTASAYRAFFHGQCGIAGAKELGKTAAPARCKFFLWLALLDRC
jgi:hypothetical protein